MIAENFNINLSVNEVLATVVDKVHKAYLTSMFYDPNGATSLDFTKCVTFRFYRNFSLSNSHIQI